MLVDGRVQTYAETYQAVIEFVSCYNNRRLYSNLHYLSPANFYRRHIMTSRIISTTSRILT
ncbi:MAG: IS3 family transposase [Moorella sp. (in: firmicutes)]